MPQVISVEEVKDAARRYYREGKLLAQNSATWQPCMYEREDGCRCAIGAVLNPVSLNRVYKMRLNFTSVAGLVRSGIIVIADGRMDAVRVIQKAHDQWLTEGTDKAKNRFLEIIDAEAHA